MACDVSRVLRFFLVHIWVFFVFLEVIIYSNLLMNFLRNISNISTFLVKGMSRSKVKSMSRTLLSRQYTIKTMHGGSIAAKKNESCK